jgi:hypothetical protein
VHIVCLRDPREPATAIREGAQALRRDRTACAIPRSDATILRHIEHLRHFLCQPEGARAASLDPRRRGGHCGDVRRVSCSASIRRSLARGIRGPIHRLRRAVAASWVARLVVVFAIVPLALSFAMPALARVVAGPPPHVCHCDVRHGHASCACPKCFPDLEEPGFAEDVLRGQCGDVEAAARDAVALDVGVPTPTFVVAPAFVSPALRTHAVPTPDGPPSAPPRRPPRRLLRSSRWA